MVKTGSASPDNLDGTADNDIINGLAGDDTLRGFGGADTINGGTGKDKMEGGIGNDVFFVDDAGDSVIEAIGEGDDEIRTALSTFTAVANVERYVFTGAKAATFLGDDAANHVTGAAFNDSLEGAKGDDTLLGGGGNDLLTGFVESPGGELDGANSLDGGAGNDTLIEGGSSDSTLQGGAGNDLLDAENTAGDTTLDGGSGADTMRGGNSNDLFVVDNAKDVVDEEDFGGDDTVQASISFNLTENGTTVLGDIENLTLLGALNLAGAGNFQANIIAGNLGANSLSGGNGDDTLRGDKGNDTLDGGDDSDEMEGGAGNDLYIVDEAGDTVFEGKSGGLDTVKSAISFDLSAAGDTENLTLTGAGAIDAFGNDLKNVLIGGDGQNSLDGGLGADTMTGGKSNDAYTVDNGGDKTIEAAGGGTGDSVSLSGAFNYTLAGNVEHLTIQAAAGAVNGTGNGLDNKITGNALHNALFGLIGLDSLSGGDGNDSLDGGAGGDSLTGGNGDDLYVIDTLADIVQEAGADLHDQIRTALQLTTANDFAGIEDFTFIGGKGVNFDANALNNKLIGTSVNDIFNGASGDDWLDGGKGADWLAGGKGLDVYEVDNAKDLVDEEFGSVGEIDLVRSSISFSLGQSTQVKGDVEQLELLGKANINGIGNALDNKLTGNGGSNKLTGAGGADTLSGGKGNDTLLGGDANDVMVAGDGNDSLDGGAGADDMTGGAGNDVFAVNDVGDIVDENADEGIDSIFSSISYDLSVAATNVENATLVEGAGNITVFGNGQRNKLTGNSGDNIIDGDRDSGDTMIGGGGDDLYFVDEGDIVIESLAGKDGGTDEVRLINGGSFTLGANLENLKIVDAAGDANGTGNTLDNILTGNNSANVLDGKGGADTMTGAEGDDTYVIDNAGDVVIESGVGDIDSVKSSFQLGLIAGIENYAFTGNKAVKFTGSQDGNWIVGTKLNDTLSGDSAAGGGDDTLNGGKGADRMNAGDGDDVYFVDNNKDVVDETGALGTDTVWSTISYSLAENGTTVRGQIEYLELIGTAAINGIGSKNADHIFGNNAANKISGAGDNDTLTGNGGNDTINGGAGADSMAGSAGNDSFVVDNAGDVVTEDVDSGIDSISSSIDFDLLAAENVENLTLTGTAVVGSGNALDNRITGNSLANLLSDSITLGNDTINGGAGNDTINGGSGNDSLLGGAGNDELFGAFDNDKINGGAGNDTVSGGAGNDTISVSAGNDVVIYGSGDGQDLIAGFDGKAAGGQDVLNLDALFDALGFADRAARVQIIDKGATVEVRVNGDLNGDFELVVARLQTPDVISVGQDVLVGS